MKTKTKNDTAVAEKEEVEEQVSEEETTSQDPSFAELTDMALEEPEDLFTLSEDAEGDVVTDADTADAKKQEKDAENSKKNAKESEEEEENSGEGESTKDEDPESKQTKAEEEEEEGDVDEPKSTNEIPSALLESLKSINPDLDTKDPEAVATAIQDLTQEKKDIEESLKKEREHNQGFLDLLEGSENFRKIARMMFANRDMSVEEAITALNIQPAVDMEKLKKEDPDKYLEIVEQNRERERKMKELSDSEKKRQEAFEENQKKTFKNVDSYRESVEIPEEEFEPVIGSLNAEIKNIADGLVTQDLIETYHKGTQYEAKIKELESEIEKAREEGRVEGRNEKIEGIKRKKQGDGLPDISTNGKPQTMVKGEKDIFDEALEEDPFDINDYTG